MAETVPGGAYLAADNKTLIDAEGRPLEKEAKAKAEEVLAEKEARSEQEARVEAANRQMAQPVLALREALGLAPATAVPAEVVEAAEADEGDGRKRGRGK